MHCGPKTVTVESDSVRKIISAEVNAGGGRIGFYFEAIWIDGGVGNGEVSEWC